FGFAEVEHDRLLAAIEPDEIGALAVNDVIVLAREIPFWPFDLDHARAGIGETACALRCRHSLLDRNDKKAIERQRHFNMTGAERARARSDTRESCSSKSVRLGTGAFRETFVRYRIPRQIRIRHGSARTCRPRPTRHRLPAAWPYWLRRQCLRRRHTC